jgi:thiol-disulfide isomerase/thioredoxin
MTSSLSIPIELQPGKARRIDQGASGAVVTGRVVTTGRDNSTLNKNWSLNYLVSRDRGVPIPQELAARLNFDPSGAVKPSWFLTPDSNSWLATRENYFVKLAPDGRLQIHGVPAGTYDLVLRLYEEPAGCLVETIGERVLTIEVTDDDVFKGNKDIGEIKVSCRTGPRVGTDMQLHKFTDTTGRERTIGDLQGQYVLMHVWASWCGPCVKLMPEVEAYVRSIAQKPATFVGYNIDGDVKRAKNLADVHNWTWSQNYLGEDSKTARQLAVYSLPSYYLVGPDGLLVAAENDWSSLQTKLDQLLDER